MRKIRTYQDVDDESGRTLVDQVAAQRSRLSERLRSVGAVVAVASGKGGVGKSALTANLSAALAAQGHEVGAVDADLNGPSLARMLGVVGRQLGDGPAGVAPPRADSGVRVMSMELLQGAVETPLRWREPDGHGFIWQSTLETGVLREFLSDVEWGRLDYLLVDVPPGTDKIGRLLALVPKLSSMILVTTPSEMSRAVVARSLTQGRESGVPALGIVANMTAFTCPDCGSVHPLFPGDGAERLSRDTDTEIWAHIPFDPRVAALTDRGSPLVTAAPDSAAARAFLGLADRLVKEAPP